MSTKHPNGYTESECLWRAGKAKHTLARMTVLNSSDDERDLCRIAIEEWTKRATIAKASKDGRWRHEYEPLADVQPVVEILDTPKPLSS